MLIYKYPFVITTLQALEVPELFKPLHAGLDSSGTPCIWAEVDADGPMKEIAVHVVGTGGYAPFGAQYISTLVQGRFVWHIYVD